MKLASGHTYEEMDAVKKKRYQKLHKGFINDMIYLNPGRWVVTKDYLKFQEKVYNFKVILRFQVLLYLKASEAINAVSLTFWRED